MSELNIYGDPMSLQAGTATAVTGTGVIVLDTPATLFVGVTGDVEATAVHSGTPVLFKNVQGNLPVLVKSVNLDAPTTATDIIALT